VNEVILSGRRPSAATKCSKQRLLACENKFTENTNLTPYTVRNEYKYNTEECMFMV
jgi:hypothetical protein